MLTRYDYETEYVIWLDDENALVDIETMTDLVFERITPAYVSLGVVKDMLISRLGDKTSRFFYTKVHVEDVHEPVIVRSLDPCELNVIWQVLPPFAVLAINNAIHRIKPIRIKSHGWHKVKVPHLKN